MKLVYMDGGLGNQAFQYIFARWVEIHSGEPCLIDDSSFFRDVIPDAEAAAKSDPVRRFPDSGYHLERVFNIKARLLSQHLPPEQWQELIGLYKRGTNVAQHLRDTGLDLFMVSEVTPPGYRGNLVTVPLYRYTPSIWRTQGHVYYFGYWINRLWFQDIRDQVLGEFVFPPIADEVNLAYQQAILNTNSVGVHVRKYVDWSHIPTPPPDYIAAGINGLRERLPDATFFVFSNDLEWCQRHARQLGFEAVADRLTYVAGNMEPGQCYYSNNNYLDLQLLSLCKHLIISHSTFSYLASMLNPHLGALYHPGVPPFNCHK